MASEKKKTLKNLPTKSTTAIENLKNLNWSVIKPPYSSQKLAENKAYIIEEMKKLGEEVQTKKKKPIRY